jgi:hypothetical protein
MSLRENELTREEKGGLQALLKKMRILPAQNCQIVLHCAQGTVQCVEITSLKLK